MTAALPGDPCAGVLCSGRGVCEAATTGSPRCSCSLGFFGADCSQSVDDGELLPAGAGRLLQSAAQAARFGWKTTPWSRCSALCGPAGTAQRNVTCRLVTPASPDEYVLAAHVLDDAECLNAGVTKPEAVTPCHRFACAASGAHAAVAVRLRFSSLFAAIGTRLRPDSPARAAFLLAVGAELRAYVLARLLAAAAAPASLDNATAMLPQGSLQMDVMSPSGDTVVAVLASADAVVAALAAGTHGRRLDAAATSADAIAAALSTELLAAGDAATSSGVRGSGTWLRRVDAGAAGVSSQPLTAASLPGFDSDLLAAARSNGAASSAGGGAPTGAIAGAAAAVVALAVLGFVAARRRATATAAAAGVLSTTSPLAKRTKRGGRSAPGAVGGNGVGADGGDNGGYVGTAQEDAPRRAATIANPLLVALGGQTAAAVAAAAVDRETAAHHASEDSQKATAAASRAARQAAADAASEALWPGPALPAPAAATHGAAPDMVEHRNPMHRGHSLRDVTPAGAVADKANFQPRPAVSRSRPTRGGSSPARRVVADLNADGSIRDVTIYDAPGMGRSTLRVISTAVIPVAAGAAAGWTQPAARGARPALVTDTGGGEEREEREQAAAAAAPVMGGAPPLDTLTTPRAEGVAGGGGADSGGSSGLSGRSWSVTTSALLPGAITMLASVGRTSSRAIIDMGGSLGHLLLSSSRSGGAGSDAASVASASSRSAGGGSGTGEDPAPPPPATAPSPVTAARPRGPLVKQSSATAIDMQPAR